MTGRASPAPRRAAAGIVRRWSNRALDLLLRELPALTLREELRRPSFAVALPCRREVV